jgi:hypothetical protein
MASLARWLRDETPADATVVASPEITEELRLRAMRAQVVMYHAVPVIPAEAREWRKRVRAVCGIDDRDPLSEATFGYLRLDAERARLLGRRYGADYVVVSDRHSGAISSLPEVFSNGAYRVYVIPGGEELNPTADGDGGGV